MWIIFIIHQTCLESSFKVLLGNKEKSKVFFQTLLLCINVSSLIESGWSRFIDDYDSAQLRLIAQSENRLVKSDHSQAYVKRKHLVTACSTLQTSSIRQEVTRPSILELISQVEPSMNQIRDPARRRIISLQGSAWHHLYIDQPSSNYLVECHHSLRGSTAQRLLSLKSSSMIRTLNTTPVALEFTLSRGD